MSKAVVAIPTVALEDPVTRLSHPTAWGVPQGGIVYTYQQLKATSVSPGSGGNITWVCPPPSPEIIVDRRVYMQVQMYLTFTATPPVGVPVLQLGLNDAPRAFPLMQAINTVSATINNNTITALMDPIIALMRYNLPYNLQQQDYTGTPCMLDQYQEYDHYNGIPLRDQPQPTGMVPGGAGGVAGFMNTQTNAVGRIDVPLPANQDGGFTRNPLSTYGTGMMAPGRGGFLMQVCSNPVGDGINQQTAGVVLTVIEPIFMTPFAQWGEEPGFYGIQTMNISLTLNANWWLRTWSSNLNRPGVLQGAAGGVVVSGSIQSMTGSLGTSTAGLTPSLLFRYITPSPIKTLPPLMEYPYTSIQVFTTSAGAIPSVYAGTANTIVTSNALQFNTIPDQIFIYLFRKAGDRIALPAAVAVPPQGTGLTPIGYSDTFASISNISINFMNQTGLLSSASQWDLYCMSKRNGYIGTYDQFRWHVGSVICLKPGLDLGLEPSLAPGMNGLYNFQVTVTFVNPSNSTVNYDLYIVPVTEGLVTIKDNGTVTQTGILTRQDVLSAQAAPSIGYTQAVQMVGGNFFGSLKNILSRAGDAIMGAVPGLIKKVGPMVAERFVPGSGSVVQGILGSGYRRGMGMYGAGLGGDGVVDPNSDGLSLDPQSMPLAMAMPGEGMDVGDDGGREDLQSEWAAAQTEQQMLQQRKRRRDEDNQDAGPPRVVSRRQQFSDPDPRSRSANNAPAFR